MYAYPYSHAHITRVNSKQACLCICISALDSGRFTYICMYAYTPARLHGNKEIQPCHWRTLN